MIAELRRQAEELAQRNLREVARSIALAGGTIDEQAAARYRAAERIVDAVDDYQHLLQQQDPEAPVYADGWTEADLRYAHGDR